MELAESAFDAAGARTDDLELDGLDDDGLDILVNLDDDDDDDGVLVDL